LGLSNRITYEGNPVLLGLSFVILLIAVVNYYLFFDVLAPGFPNGGSVKASMGAAFLAPILILTAIQVLFSSGVLHLTMRAFYPEKRDYLKSFFVGSVLVALFSVYYTLVPSYGPYTILTGWYRGVGATDYLMLAGWTALMILTTTLLIRRIFRFTKGEIRWTMLVLISGTLFLLALAFAEG
jgi:hypothetical protein